MKEINGNSGRLNMNSNKAKKFEWELDYVDIVFGAIIALGFTNYEKITSIYGYFLFFFVYLMGTEYYFDWKKVVSRFKTTENYLRAMDIPVLLLAFQIVINSYKGELLLMYSLMGSFFIADALWSSVKFLEFRKDHDGRRLFSYFVIHDIVLITLFFSLPSIMVDNLKLLALMIIIYCLSSIADYVIPKRMKIEL